MSQKRVVSVTGLGYVGLPVSVTFALAGYKVVAFDIDERRIRELKAYYDRTHEVSVHELQQAGLCFTSDLHDLSEANFHIVTVPTPIKENKHPDFGPLHSATRSIGKVLKPDDIVVYESTVYPGVTEEICVPVLEAESGLALNKDFAVGYSPERINPGDSAHRFENIAKVVSASSNDALNIIAGTYDAVINAQIHRASSIKVAEAAKVIENTQRDLNIALMNELAIIFDRIGIRTKDVLDAAGTKWNFLHFSPGLVGGHCIGVDPYYLTAKAEALGYTPEVILAGRRTNDGMAEFVASKLIKLLLTKGRSNKAKVGILGITFKENVPDLRNSKVPDIFSALGEYGISALLHDPLADSLDVHHEYGITLSLLQDFYDLDALILAVPHKNYLESGSGWFFDCLKQDGILIDVKSVVDTSLMKACQCYWSV